MNILGIGNPYHDSSACLLIDGRLVAAAEEERFIRQKHATGEYPLEAIRYCLAEAGLKPSDIHRVAHGTSPEAYDRLKWPYFFRAIGPRPGQAVKAITKAGARKKNWRKRIPDILRLSGINPDQVKIYETEHHLAHAASAFYLSGFPDAAFLTMDGSGEFTSTLLGSYDSQGKAQIFKEFIVPDSLGFFYATMTDYLGFEHDDGEYKVMGMASYGDASRYNLDDLVTCANGSYRVNDDYIYAVRRKRWDKEKWFSRKMVERFGPPRSNDDLMEPYIHIAAAVQKKFEDVALALVDHYLTDALKKSDGRLCFSGGCALNVKLNKKLIEHPLIKELWVQPASNDGGIALGAAVAAAHAEGEKIAPMQHAYWGPQFSNQEIHRVFAESGYPLTHEKNITDTVSRLLHQGKVVAWFQGRMEWGPRALGNRSILGNPTNRGTADKINEAIKFREQWRPFCPSILAEHAHSILDTSHASPFMTFCFTVRPEWRERLPEVVHVDQTARPQFVTREANPRYYELIEKFYHLSGVPALINTSLNRRGEPMVCSPADALDMFRGSGLTHLAIGDYLVTK